MTTPATIEASASVVNGVAYFGSWDGNEYAVDARSGQPLWTSFIDTTPTEAGCNAPWPLVQGVSSTADLTTGELYVGGGGEYWYAMNAADGGLAWNVFTGDNSTNGGYYNWASPLIANGSAYINIASGGNCPSVQGAVLQVDLASHQVINTFDLVPNGQQGAAAWSTPAYDEVTDTVFVSTGSYVSGTLSTQPYAEALVALRGADLSFVDSWQIPASDDTGDSDFGTTPTLFEDASGHARVGLTNKNGIFYAFDRGNLSAGPVWQFQVAVGGGNPEGGDGSISSAAFDGQTLFVAGGNTTIAGNSFSGSVRALDPATGAPRWEQGASAPILGALATANGLVIDACGDSLEVRDASNGNVLYSASIDTMASSGVILSAAPIIANGVIYEGSPDGTMNAFGL